MMRTNGRSKAMFGGPLWGDQAVRYIFMDEAGTSAKEPVTVVVGIIANADEHVLSAEALALEELDAVPPVFKEGFVFHAKEVFGDQKYQSKWSMTDRLRLLQGMMSIPARIGLSICLSAHWRGTTDWPDMPHNLSTAQSDHYWAFMQCVGVCDRNIRRYAGPREVATIVAEDVPDMRRFLKQLPRVMREKPYYFTQEAMRATEKDKELGYINQSGDMRVSRIRNSVHFVEKSEDPLVQVADACAYGFRRYLSGQSFGAEFARAIIGDERLLSNFASPGGVECWWTRSNVSGGA